MTLLQPPISAIRSLPALSVAFDGKPAARQLLDGLVQVSLRLAPGRPAMADLMFEDTALNTRILPGVDATVEMRIGSTLRFRGVVRQTQWQRQADGRVIAHVIAADGLAPLARTCPERRFAGRSTIDILREVAFEHGLEVDTVQTGPTWPVILQYGRSDLSLIAELTERSGLLFTLDDRSICVFSPDGRRAGGEPAVEIPADRVHAFRSSAGPAAPAAVSSSTFDAVEARAVTVMALAGDDLDAPTDDSEWVLAPPATGSDDIVLALAEAERVFRATRAQQIVVDVDGEAAPRPGERVRLPDSVAGSSIEFTAGVIEHTVNAESGHVAAVHSLLAPSLTRPQVSLSLGEVVDTDDPLRAGRVRARLWMMGGLESDWLRAALPGAGPGKGFYGTASNRDIVLIALVDPLAGSGFVLGGVAGLDDLTKGAHPSRFGICFASGAHIEFDDANHMLRVRSAQGSELCFERSRSRLRSTAPMTIEAPGSTLTIRAEKINFEQG